MNRSWVQNLSESNAYNFEIIEFKKVLKHLSLASAAGVLEGDDGEKRKN
jgi:hypothetical protein